MPGTNEKEAAPIPSVGADGEQPTNNTTCTVADDAGKSNPPEKSFEQLIRELDEASNPNHLHTVTMSDLMETAYEGRLSVIDGLLHPGTYLFAGAPKVGKSFLVAQIAYHVSMGIPLWGYNVRQGTVLYLALEDDPRRLQERLYRMFGTECSNKLRMAVAAKHLGEGLEGQIKKFIKDYPDTKLVIIDTLQKIREATNDKLSYAGDYDTTGKIKQLADEHGLCLLLVHHTRKQQADDKFDMISGTNGLFGAADGAFILHKEKRTDLSAILEIVGRDQQEQRLHLLKDRDRLIWTLERAEAEPWVPPPDPVLDAVAAVVTSDKPEWSGTATELAGVIDQDIKPNKLTQRLNVNAGRLLNEYGVLYKPKRTHAGRQVKLTLTPKA